MFTEVFVRDVCCDLTVSSVSQRKLRKAYLINQLTVDVPPSVAGTTRNAANNLTSDIRYESQPHNPLIHEKVRKLNKLYTDFPAVAETERLTLKQ